MKYIDLYFEEQQLGMYQKDEEEIEEEEDGKHSLEIIKTTTRIRENR